MSLTHPSRGEFSCPLRLQRNWSKGSKGFNLVEIMVVIALIGILSAVATPAFLQMAENMRLNSAILDLYSTIVRAKGEAAKRNRNCTVVFNQPISGTTFDYVLFEDSNPGVAANRTGEYDPGEQIIVQGMLPRGITLNTTPPDTTIGNNDDQRPAISFTPTSLPSPSGRMTLNSATNRPKEVVVNVAGNIRVNVKEAGH